MKTQGLVNQVPTLGFRNLGSGLRNGVLPRLLGFRGLGVEAD